MINNYDKVSSFYDGLSRIVFFRSQMNAQIAQLKYIPQGGRILIAGGGTGWILEEITRIQPEGLFITYVELSANMIALSKKRVVGDNQVEFINESIEHFQSADIFDVVITPFLFDNFYKEKAASVFMKTGQMLSSKGYWLFTDFTLEQGKGRFWKTLTLKVMYSFFKLFGITEAKQLVEMKPYFQQGNYQQVEDRLYYSGFIQAMVFKKLPSGD